MIGHHGAQMLEGFIFIFHRAFQPVLRIEIQNDTALIKTMVAVRTQATKEKRMGYTMRDVYSVMLKDYPDVMNIE